MRTLAILLFTASFTPTLAAPEGETPITFEAHDGSTTEGMQGSFEVQENRSDPESRTLTLGYVRFPATTETPGSPIVYLAGGPGGTGTGTAKGPRFPLFMAMRAHADVIAFDQRGTGLSDEIDNCTSDITVPLNEVVTDEDYIGMYRQAFAECQSFWSQSGVDLAGYNTNESAADLDALRVHLGAEKVSLWGISYGSHLALAAMKVMPNELDRVVIASVEGLDQTVKLPSRTDSYFDALQAVVNSQEAARAAFPDIKSLITRVHQKLDEHPVEINIPLADGGTDSVLWTRGKMQRVGSAMIADPGYAGYLLSIYKAADQGDYSLLTGLMARFHNPDSRISLNGMSVGMDLASGISADRFEQFKREAATALNGQWHNFPMPQLVGVAPELDLGDEFRIDPVNDIPTLVLSGTLDGRTYPQSQSEAVAGLSNRTEVTVVNAGHNLFMTTPEVGEAMAAFFENRPISTTTIIAPLSEFIDE